MRTCKLALACAHGKGPGCELSLGLNGDMFTACTCASPNVFLVFAFAFARFISLSTGMFESKSEPGSKFKSRFMPTVYPNVNKVLFKCKHTFALVWFEFKLI